MRFALPYVAAALLPALAVACSSAADSPGVGVGVGADAGPPPGPAEWNRKVTPPSDQEASQKRLACGYSAGSLPAETQGASHPNGAEIPVDHVLVMMMENRSFDHYFQDLPTEGQPDAEVAPKGFSNPDGNGKAVPIFHESQYCIPDTNHGWAGSHAQVNGGKMDGFFTTNDQWSQLPPGGTPDMLSGKRAMGHFSAADLPFYYWLANEFAIADHYHCSLLGPTWPNRMYLYAATSFGKTTNTAPNADKTLPDYLEERGVDWKIYASGTPGFGMFVTQFLKYQKAHRRTIDDYFADAAAGTLPQFAFVDPKIGAEAYNQNDEHPPAIPMIGEAFVAKIVDALTKSPNWARSAMFLTYDEHGGLYDHVVPPKACAPDGLAPEGEPAGAFDQLGIRVPLTVVSPFAKKHFVSHHVYDHTSIVRFVEARFVMPALTKRDANAEAPWEMFDFEGAPHIAPPAITIPSVPQATIDACAKIFAP